MTSGDTKTLANTEGNVREPRASGKTQGGGPSPSDGPPAFSDTTKRLAKPVRKPVVTKRVVMRDWFSCSITLKRGLTGAKPEALCHWAFEMVGAEPTDALDDLFPGTGAVTAAWSSWRAKVAA